MADHLRRAESNALSNRAKRGSRRAVTLKDHWVYLAEMKDGRLYVGMTNKLPRRAREHRQGKLGTRTTRVFGFCGMRYAERHADRVSAQERECQLKKWSRAKKEALIAGDKATLKKLAKSRTR